MLPHQVKNLCWLAGGLHLSAVFMRVPVSPAHLHNCVLCSCRLAVASTCPTPDCKTPQRPDCSCRRLLPPRTVSCSQHTHLSAHTHTECQSLEDIFQNEILQLTKRRPTLPALRRHMFMSATCRQLLVLGS